MKYFILISVVFIAFACGNTKEVIEEPPVLEEIVENYRVIGIVHVSKTDCPLYISVKDPNKPFTLYPMNLDDKFKREGMKLKFEYTPSKGSQPAGCSVDIVASLSDVTLMR